MCKQVKIKRKECAKFDKKSAGKKVMKILVKAIFLIFFLAEGISESLVDKATFDLNSEIRLD